MEKIGFVSDEDEEVRTGVAENPNTPLEVLADLVTETNEFVRKGVLVNEKSTPEIEYNRSHPKEPRKS